MAIKLPDELEFEVHGDFDEIKILIDALDDFETFLKENVMWVKEVRIRSPKVLVVITELIDDSTKNIMDEVLEATRNYMEIIQRADRLSYRYGSALFQYDEDVVEITNEEMPEKGSALINKEALIACAVHLLKEKYNR